jgi:hypothetical protein
MENKLKTAVMIIAIFGIMALSFFGAYQIGYRTGAMDGANTGAKYGINLLASNLCENNRTFTCNQDKICGCFSVTNLATNTTGGI